MEIRDMTALELGEKIRDRELSSVEAVRSYLDAIREEGKTAGAYITVMEEEALAQAKSVQEKIDRGERLSPLAGVPVAVKDNICTKEMRTTAASRMLEGFLPPYDATVIERLKAAGAVILGKTNLDEFAMGGSTETSYYGIARNPWGPDRVPGGSSGGSAAAVAARLAPYALGSDTGGSIRQPCAFCNLTGIKPTYGSVSRYGLMAYASSLDQIGTMGRDIKDCASSLALISGYDPLDSTSVMKEPFNFSGIYDGYGGALGNSAEALAGSSGSLSGLKIGLPKNYFETGISADVKEAVLAAAKAFETLGAAVEEFEIPAIDYAVPAYYIIACAEASSNLSRYDGIKYGFRSEHARDLSEILYRSRSEGFGREVKRRIMLGSFVLSSGYFDAYYKKALQVRGLIKSSFDEAFSKYDMILGPVSPTTAYPIGEQIEDPLAMYMADIYTVSVNLSGLPAVALPCGFDRQGMPVGMQLIGRAFSEATLVGAAQAYQDNTDYHTKFPESGIGENKGKRPEENVRSRKGGQDQ